MNFLKPIPANSPLLLIIAAFVAVPLFITNMYYLQVLVFIGIYAILALSLNLLNGYVGLLSSGHAAFYAIGAYASAKLNIELQLPWGLSMIGAGAIAGLFGYLISKPTLRLSGIYMRLVLTVVSMHRLMTCRFGRALTAIRENELAAKAAGVDTTRYKVQAFVLAAFYAGIAGSFYAHFVKYISPDSFTINESFILLAMLAFGGQGNLIGPMTGAAALILIPEVFRPLQEYRMFVYGGILVVMMLVRRQGLFGGRSYRLRLSRFDPSPVRVYRRGDKFLPED